ncbi:MAG: hypothetical protein WBC93_10950 [Sulfitobacter sp.]|jgi:hypothetical protein|tara:strand:- start:4750 stop:5166 length:417 start_codon:yes stop_codon:yes gene_type:complete
MRFKNRLVSMLIAALAATPAVAWEHDFTRGLDLYSTTDNGATIRLVCDPNRVYGGTESMVLIVLGGNSDLTTMATLAFPDGQTITAPLVHGRLAKRDLAENVWHPILEGLRNTQRVELTVGDTTRAMNLGDAPAFTCI